MAYRDKGKKNSYHREWRTRNKERLAELQRQWLSNPENAKKRELNWRRWRRENPLLNWAQEVIRNHKRRGYEVYVNTDELMGMAQLALLCPYCGIILDYSYKEGNGSLANSPSIDRINNGNIISKGTIQIVCRRCNISKQNRTHDEFVGYCQNIVEKFGEIV